jgi:iron complex outermembrane receptor protein
LVWCSRKTFGIGRKLAAGFLFICVGTAAAEPEATLSGEDVFLFDIPVVLHVSRLAQPTSETPAAVTVIDREMIRASGLRKIADLFRLVPGFLVGYNHGFQPVVAYHGLSDSYSRRMQVLVDGRSVYTATIGGVLWTYLPLPMEDIDRIEVIRGSNTAAYGSNAFMGVINIITLHASQTQGAAVGLAAGEHHVRDGFARHGWRSDDGEMRLSVSYQKDDGFDDLPDTQKVPIAVFRGDFRLSPGDTLETQIGVNDDQHTAGHPGRRVGHLGNTTDPPRDAEVWSHFQQLHWRRMLSASEEIGLQFYHTYMKKNEDFLTAPFDLTAIGLGVIQIPVSLDIVDERYDLEFQHTLAPFQNWRFVWGMGTRLDRVWSQPYFDTNETLENDVHRLFGSAEWRASQNAIVNAGAMLENNGIGGTDFSPRLAYNHHLSSTDTVRLVASKATRSPTLFEEKSNFRFYYQGIPLERESFSPGGLAPERMTSYEAGYLGWLLERHLAVDVRLFQDRVRDLITEIEIPDNTLDGRTFSFRNEGEVDVSGAEVQLDYRPSRDTRVFLGYARLRAVARGLSAQASFTVRNHEDSVPSSTTSALLAQRLLGPWWLSAAYYRVPRLFWLGEGDRVDGYTRTDVRFAREFRLDGKHGEFALVVQNSRSPYADFDNGAQFDRRAFVTFSLKP